MRDERADLFGIVGDQVKPKKRAETAAEHQHGPGCQRGQQGVGIVGAARIPISTLEDEQHGARRAKLPCGASGSVLH